MSAEPLFVWLRPLRLGRNRFGVRGPARHSTAYRAGGRQRFVFWAYRPFRVPHRRGPRYWQLRRRRAFRALEAQLAIED